MTMKEDQDFDPAKVNSTFYLFEHIAIKGVQAGTLLGLFLAVPVAAFRHKRAGGALNASFVPRAQAAMGNTAVMTTIISCLAGVGLIGFKEGWDKEKIEDRVYRLHYNEGQNRVDNFAEFGFVGGAAAAYLAGARSLNGLAAGSLTGIAAGTLLHVLTSQSDTKSQIETAKDSVRTVAEEVKR